MHRFSGRGRPSPAMVVAFVALLAALSGTAVALPGTNTVDSGDIKQGAVKTKDIANGAVTTKKLKNGAVATKKLKNGAVNSQKVKDESLTGADINESTLGEVPSANTANTAGNADRLDNLDSADFLRSNSFGVALAGANVTSAGALSAWFNRFGGQPTVTRTATGTYQIVFPGLEGQLLNSEAIHMATLFNATGFIRASSSGGNPLVLTFNTANTAADRSFYYTAFGTNLTP
jgi:hypothetical protein